MANIVWTDGAATDGSTVWNAARETQIRTDITAQVNGNLDANNLANGAVTRAKMASGNQDVVQAVTIPLNDEVVLTSRIGFSQGTGTKEFYGGTCKVAMTLTDADFSADTVDSNSAVFQVSKNGTAVGSSATISAGTSPQTSEVTGMTISFADGDRLGVLVNGSGGTTNVAGAHAILYLKRTLA